MMSQEPVYRCLHHISLHLASSQLSESRAFVDVHAVVFVYLDRDWSACARCLNQQCDCVLMLGSDNRSFQALPVCFAALPVQLPVPVVVVVVVTSGVCGRKVGQIRRRWTPLAVAGAMRRDACAHRFLKRPLNVSKVIELKKIR